MADGKAALKGWTKRLEAAKERGGVGLIYLGPNKSFPVKRGDCMGLKAAFSRARQYGHDDIARKALGMARTAECQWAINRTTKGGS